MDADTKQGTADHEASGRFVIRLEPGLHAALKAAAAAGGVSLNAYCAHALAASAGGMAAGGGAAAIVERAAAFFGEGLVGVVVFGSWVRGEALADSDVDVLVVVDADVALSRGTYRAWDAQPIRWEARDVDAHFAHLPADADGLSSIWVEAAIDGVILFERGWQVSRVLARARRDLAAGALVRHVVHGQPYYVAGG